MNWPVNWLRRRSLARRIALAFLLSHAAMLFAVMMLLQPLMSLDEENLFGPDIAVELAAAVLVHRAGETPRLGPSPALRSLAERNPDLWIVVQTPEAHVLHGRPAPAGWALAERLPPAVIAAQLGIPGLPLARGRIAVMTVDGSPRPVRLIAGGVSGDAVGWRSWLAFLSATGFLWFGLFVALLGVGAVSLAVPFVLRAVRPLAAEAAAVGPDGWDRRLSEDRAVVELRPVARGFNAALDRLAEAYGRQRRFVADMAHELRTPVAVLGAQVDLLPDVPGKTDLKRGVARLGGLVGQMLDAQRLVLAERRREPVDLVRLAREVAADMAPLALASGYELAVEAEPTGLWASVDPQAIARALGNLLGNAVAHGGGAGLITIGVGGDGAIEVADQGPGVPDAARERVFEPFRRERWDRDGCGLGLHLVREIMRAHGGDVRLLEQAAGSARGATFRLELPEAALIRNGGTP